MAKTSQNRPKPLFDTEEKRQKKLNDILKSQQNQQPPHGI